MNNEKNKDIIAEIVKGDDDVKSVCFLNIFDVHKAMNLAREQERKRCLELINEAEPELKEAATLDERERIHIAVGECDFMNFGGYSWVRYTQLKKAIGHKLK